MNCVAIPHTEDKRSIVATQLPPPSLSSLHIMQNEFTLPTPIIIDHSNSAAAATAVAVTVAASGGGCGSNVKLNPTFTTTIIGGNKTQSLQRSATTMTHLYCRSLDKDATSMATPHRRTTTSTSRSLASCLRGERDDPYIDYQKRALQYDTARRQQQQQQRNQQQQQRNQQQHTHQHQHQHQHQQHQYQFSQSYDDNHPVQVLQSSLISMSSCVNSTNTDDAISLSRSEYKSKTLPRIHFDNFTNDASLNEGIENNIKCNEN